MRDTHSVVLCRYHYDPLDRMAGSSPAGADTVQWFYQKSRLATEIQGPVRRVVFQFEQQLLAQHESGGGRDSSVLLATDQQRSVLHQVDATQQTARVYTAYGFDAAQVNFPGFNGEHPDPLTGHYLLGNGYRAFNPVLMRFNSPDSLSPFGKGGLNGYTYCAGDPVNRVDPTGHTPLPAKIFLRWLKIMKPSRQARADRAYELIGLRAASGESGSAGLRVNSNADVNVETTLSQSNTPVTAVASSQPTFAAQESLVSLDALVMRRNELNAFVDRPSTNRNPLAMSRSIDELIDIDARIQQLETMPPPDYESLPPSYDSPDFPPTYKAAMTARNIRKL